MEASGPSIGFPDRDLMEGSWDVQVLCAGSVKSWMWTFAFSLMAYSAAMERMDLDTARMSSYAASAAESSNSGRCSGYAAFTIEGQVSLGRRGRRCQSSSVRKGMNGWIIVSPPSRAV